VGVFVNLDDLGTGFGAIVSHDNDLDGSLDGRKREGF